MQLSEIIDRLEFIKGNIIADQRQEAFQQTKELLELLHEWQRMELAIKIKERLRKEENYNS